MPLTKPKTDLRTRVQQLPGMPTVTAIKVTGYITYTEARALRDVILPEIDSSQISAVVIELGSVKHIDTAGVAVLVESLVAGEQQGINVLLCRPSISVTRIFSHSGMQQALDCCCTSETEMSDKLRHAANE